MVRRLSGLAVSAALLVARPGPAPAQDTLHVSPFGPVTLYRQTPHPSRVVLFLSGDGGWNLGVVDMARSLAALDALVVGIDVPRYLRSLAASGERCSYPPGDLESLSKVVQKRLGFEAYVNPVLVGYSSGATLAYTTLAQAPVGTFAGAISMGFCPDLTLAKPLCRQNQLAWAPDPVRSDYRFEPVARTTAPWVVLHGDEDQVCSLAAVRSFVAKVEGATLVVLPGVGHGFSVQRNWMPQFREAFRGMGGGGPAAPSLPPPVADLPLTELPAQGSAGTMAVIVTGDGGWAGIDQQIGHALEADGISVVGLSSLKYFWRTRTPDSAAADLARVLAHYLEEWKKERVILVGYSFGAEVLPFMVNRLPANLRDRIAGVALLAPGPTADFTFHVGDWLNLDDKDALPTLPEVKRMAVPRLLCFRGRDETDSICSRAAPPAVDIVLPGGHHFDGDYQAIVARLRSEFEGR